MQKKTDFSTGPVWKRVMEMALPLTAALAVDLLYNIVDRMYIGRIAGTGTLALTGVGLCFPIVLIVSAFSRLFGTGGSPLCSIELGKGNTDEAARIMGTSFFLLVCSSVLLMAAGFIFMKPFLYAFGASDAIYPYARNYLSIYLLGTVFVLLNSGLNCYITCQGFAKTGMTTVLIGAVTNIVLDPLFIFVFGLGVRGAAIATVIAQAFSCTWLLLFLSSSRSTVKLRPEVIKPAFFRIKRIVSLGFSSCIMALTTSLVQIVCNKTLQQYGGDLYISAMTIIISVREIISVPAQGIHDGTIPVLSYNYGNSNPRRVEKGILFMSVTNIIYMLIAWLSVYLFPGLFIRIFSSDVALLEIAKPALRIYFIGYVFMALQFSGQGTFVALNKPKRAIIFSLLRKVVIVVPLTILLPRYFNLGTTGVFLAEPVSNVIGATACFVTMLCTILPELKKMRLDS